MQAAQPGRTTRRLSKTMSKKSTSERSTSERLMRAALFSGVRGAAYTAGAVMVTAAAWWLQSL